MILQYISDSLFSSDALIARASWQTALLGLFFIILVAYLLKPSNQDVIGPDGKPVTQGPPETSTLFGHLSEFVKPLAHRSIHDLHERYGPLFPMRLFLRRVFVVTGPKQIKQILQNRPKDFSRDYRMRIIMREGGTGLFDSEGDEWHRLRKMTSPAFTPTMVHGMTGCMLKYALIMRDKWTQVVVKSGQGQAILNGDRDFMETAMHVFVETTFGESALKNITDDKQQDISLVEEFSHVMPEVYRRMIMLFPEHQSYRRRYLFRTTLEREHDQRSERCFASAEKILHYYIRNFHSSDSSVRDARKGRDLADLFIRANEKLLKTEQGVREFVHEFRYLLFQLIVAGFETTASTLPVILYYLAKNPAILKRVQTICDALIDPETGKPVLNVEDADQMNDLSTQLNYVQHVIREAMRLRPVAPLLGHVVNHDLTLDGGYKLPQGTFVMTAFYGAERRAPDVVLLNKEKGFPSLDEFEPDRWTDEELSRKLMENFFVFGGGIRICPGRFLSMMEMQLIVAFVFGFFDLKLVNEDEVQDVRRFTNRLENVKVELKPRPQYAHLCK